MRESPDSFPPANAESASEGSRESLRDALRAAFRSAPGSASGSEPRPKPRFWARRTGRAVDRIMPHRPRRASESLVGRVVQLYMKRLTDPAGALMRNFDLDEVRVRLMRGGFPLGLRVDTFVLLKIAATFAVTALFALYFPILNLVLDVRGWQMPLAFLPFWIVLGGFYGFRLPDAWLSLKIRERQNEILLALPDMIDLIAVSVEAGLGLVAAIQRVSERFDHPLAEEFLRMLQELRLGRPQSTALRDMAQRLDVSDLSMLIMAIIQAETLGLSISNVLKIQAERLRQRRAQRARETAQKAPTKIVFPLVFFIFPALFVVILGPAIIRIIMEPHAF